MLNLMAVTPLCRCSVIVRIDLQGSTGYRTGTQNHLSHLCSPAEPVLHLTSAAVFCFDGHQLKEDMQHIMAV